jgi:hypothetical protein
VRSELSRADANDIGSGGIDVAGAIVDDDDDTSGAGSCPRQRQKPNIEQHLLSFKTQFNMTVDLRRHRGPLWDYTQTTASRARATTAWRRDRPSTTTTTRAATDDASTTAASRCRRRAKRAKAATTTITTPSRAFDADRMRSRCQSANQTRPNTHEKLADVDGALGGGGGSPAEVVNFFFFFFFFGETNDWLFAQNSLLLLFSFFLFCFLRVLAKLDLLPVSESRRQLTPRGWLQTLSARRTLSSVFFLPPISS